MTKTFIYYKKYNINYKDKRGVDEMTERVVNQLNVMNELLSEMNSQLGELNAREGEANNGTFARVIDWMLTYGPNGTQECDIYVQIRVQTPRGHKIYECKGCNILDNKGDYIIIESEDTNKIEMINKDYVYNITLDIAEEK